jgi:hypothetical protein
VSTVITTTSAATTALTGRPSQSHIFYGENTSLWWVLWVDGGSQTTLRSASSPDGITWTARTTFTLAFSQDRGSNIGVGYKNIGSTDVVMIQLHYFVSAATQHSRYLRATISGTTITYGTETLLNTDPPGTDANNNESGAATAASSDNFWHLGESMSVAAGNVGNPAIQKSSNADTGASWTTGFAAIVQLAPVTDYSHTHILIPLATGTMLLIATNAAAANTYTDLNYKAQSTWTATWTGSPLSGAISAQNQNDWHACRVDDTHIHLVARTGSNTYTHRTFDGSTWSAGASITNQNSQAGAGLFLASDGTDVWLFVIDSDAANTIRYCKYSGGSWGSWAALVSTTKTRTWLSGYPVAKNNEIHLLWADANGANSDLSTELLSIAAAPSTDKLSPIMFIMPIPPYAAMEI